MVALAIAGMIAAFMWLTRDVEARAAAVAAQNGSSLIHVDVGLGPCCSACWRCWDGLRLCA